MRNPVPRIRSLTALWPALRSAPLSLLLLALPAAAAAAPLTALEQRWLQGIWPVVSHAKARQLPLDIVVQPQPTPQAAPLSLGFVDGRCKLVLSMRGNPEAEATLARIAPQLLDATLELMAAHELGHCHRYLDGVWKGGLPAGFVANEPQGLDAQQRARYREMQSSRREEAYGDLVGLAWTRARHPALYAALQAWLCAERAADRIPGSPHDTLAWVRLAEKPEALEAPGGSDSIFAAAAPLWARGLVGSADGADGSADGSEAGDAAAGD
ncbi:MAG: hypothetical protein ABW005_06915 [Burkholderiaceae bacterium]